MINLINPEDKKFQRERKFARMAFLFLLFFVFVALVFWAVMLLLKHDESINNNKLTLEIEEVDKDLVKHRDLEKQLKDVNNDLKTIEKITFERIAWSKILTDFASHTPSEVQITNISVKVTPADKKTVASTVLNLTAIAKNLENIEQFQKSLDGSPYFESSSFKSASLNQQVNGFSFNLTTTCTLNPKEEK